MNKLQLIKYFVLTFWIALLSTMSSCQTEEFPNLLVDEYGEDSLSVSLGTPKVLYVIIDGASGRAVDSSNCEFLKTLRNHSLFTFSGLVDPGTKVLANGSAWATMMTGVTQSKHGVARDSLGQGNLADFPSFLSLMKSVRPDLGISSFCSSQKFAEYFTNEADEIEVIENYDVKIKEAAVEAILNTNQELIIVQFHEVDRVGSTKSYNPSDLLYKDEIRKIDGYIEEMVNAIRDRNSYSEEDWLVVVASNKGGRNLAGEVDPFDDYSRNTFVQMFNPRIVDKFIRKPTLDDVPFADNAVRYIYPDVNWTSAVLSDSSKYNMGTSGGMTFQFLIKSKSGSYNYPTVLSKRASDFSGPGWNLFLKGDAWTINTSMSSELGGTTVSDDAWHSITVVFSRIRNLSTTVKVYTDGQLNGTTTRNNTNDILSNTVPLRIGRIPSNGNNAADILVSRLQVYDVALSDDDVSENACKTKIDEEHPLYDNLVGYWPGTNPDDKGLLKETTGRGANFILSGQYGYMNFNDAAPNLCPPPPPSYYRLVPNSTDLPFQIMMWLGVVPREEWQLEGKGWPFEYTIL